MKTIEQIVAEEIELSITCARHWGKSEVFNYLTELRLRIQQRLKKLEKTEIPNKEAE